MQEASKNGILQALYTVLWRIELHIFSAQHPISLLLSPHPSTAAEMLDY
jgi:hypothetical protein